LGIRLRYPCAQVGGHRAPGVEADPVAEKVVGARGEVAGAGERDVPGGYRLNLAPRRILAEEVQQVKGCRLDQDQARDALGAHARSPQAERAAVGVADEVDVLAHEVRQRVDEFDLVVERQGVERRRQRRRAIPVQVRREHPELRHEIEHCGAPLAARARAAMDEDYRRSRAFVGVGELGVAREEGRHASVVSRPRAPTPP
jgi:hypothetical protein